MSETATRRRRPPLNALLALEIIVRLNKRELSWWAFKAATPTQWHTGMARLALNALERRGWIVMQSGAIVLTDAGHRAATTGEGVAPPKTIQRQPPRTRHNRLPRGLF